MTTLSGLKGIVIKSQQLCGSHLIQSDCLYQEFALNFVGQSAILDPHNKIIAIYKGTPFEGRSKSFINVSEIEVYSNAYGLYGQQVLYSPDFETLSNLF